VARSLFAARDLTTIHLDAERMSQTWLARTRDADLESRRRHVIWHVPRLIWLRCSSPRPAGSMRPPFAMSKLLVCAKTVATRLRGHYRASQLEFQ
jgi:hypothetical protein